MLARQASELGATGVLVKMSSTKNGFNEGEVFILPAQNGTLAKGTYVEDGDGEIDNSVVSQFEICGRSGVWP